MGEIAGIRKRGGRVLVVDPRRTGTAEKADEWLPINPGTDAALLMAVVHVLFADDRVDLGTVAELVDGLDRLREASADWTPERVAGVTGIDADRIRALAHELADTERAVVYGRIGLCNQEFGTLASWLVDVVNILTRHFDVPGGLMFPRASAWSVSTLPMEGLDGGAANFGRWRSRVRDVPEVLGHVPVSCLHEEISTPGEGQIRALITVAGNPVLSTPEGDRLDAALPQLACMVSVDNWVNETTRHADVILPGLSALEQAHHDDLIWQFAVGSGAKYSAPVFPVDPDRPREWEVLIRLAGACLGQPMAEVDVAGDRRRLLRRPGHDAGPRRADPARAVRRGRAGAAAGLHPAHRPVRRPLRRRTGRHHAPAGQGQPARCRPRPDGAHAARGAQDGRRARSCSLRTTSSATCRAWRRASSATRSSSCSPAAGTCARTTPGCTTSRR